MQTDYAAHDRLYQARRHDPSYVGWVKHQEFADDWQLIWQPLMQKTAFPPQGKLLELGCGAGNVSINLAQQGYAVTGIDIAPTAIAWAIDNAKVANVNANFLVGDVVTLSEIPDAAFDIALDGHCLHCIIGDDRAQFLRSVDRILRVGGIFTVCTMCNEIPDIPEFQATFDRQSRCTIHDGIATRYIGDSNQILQEIIQAGFRILDVELIAPKQPEDLADLWVIAQKRSAADPP
jgi:ubiquinone/menaquinone biosynthesis C-methylase UbiE